MKKLTFFVLAASLASSAFAQSYSAEEAIRWRQSAYQILNWNMTRLEQNVKSPQFNQQDAIKAAKTISAIANSGMGQLFFKGSESSNQIQTKARAEFFTDTNGAAQAAKALVDAAAALEKATQSGDVAVVKKELDNLGGACGGCHKKFKQR